MNRQTYIGQYFLNYNISYHTIAYKDIISIFKFKVVKLYQNNSCSSSFSFQFGIIPHTQEEERKCAEENYDFFLSERAKI